MGYIIFCVLVLLFYQYIHRSSSFPEGLNIDYMFCNFLPSLGEKHKGAVLTIAPICQSIHDSINANLLKTCGFSYAMNDIVLWIGLGKVLV
jgi:hypothetical protein